MDSKYLPPPPLPEGYKAGFWAVAPGRAGEKIWVRLFWIWKQDKLMNFHHSNEWRGGELIPEAFRKFVGKLRENCRNPENCVNCGWKNTGNWNLRRLRFWEETEKNFVTNMVILQHKWKFWAIVHSFPNKKVQKMQKKLTKTLVSGEIWSGRGIFLSPKNFPCRNRGKPFKKAKNVPNLVKMWKKIGKLSTN